MCCCLKVICSKLQSKRICGKQDKLATNVPAFFSNLNTHGCILRRNVVSVGPPKINGRFLFFVRGDLFICKFTTC